MTCQAKHLSVKNFYNVVLLNIEAVIKLYMIFCTFKLLWNNTKEGENGKGGGGREKKKKKKT